MGENDFAPVPTALYGVVLLMAAVAWTILQATIIAAEGEGSKLKKAVGSDWKGKFSLAAYVVGVALATRWVAVALALYVLVALIWLVPDRRIERTLETV